MNIAITGGSGYIGLNLASLLLQAGHQVRCLDRVRSPRLDPRVTFFQTDIFDDKALDAALDGVDVVYHLVAMITLAQENAAAWRVNVEGVRGVAEAALRAKVKRMVHVSSCASFDQVLCKGSLSETSPRSTNAALPVYSRSKYAGEMEFLKVVEKGLDGVICYPTGVYGPIDYSPNISRISKVLLDSARGTLPAMAVGSFDLVDVRDVAAGLILAAERGRTGENYLLGGHYIGMMEACRLAASFVGRKGPGVLIPMKAMKTMALIATMLGSKAAAEEGPFSKNALETIETSPRVNRGKAEADLGYRPRSVETTIRDLITFFVEQGEFRKALSP